jgi:hypothetical protein
MVRTMVRPTSDPAMVPPLPVGWIRTMRPLSARANLGNGPAQVRWDVVFAVSGGGLNDCLLRPIPP